MGLERLGRLDPAVHKFHQKLQKPCAAAFKNYLLKIISYGAKNKNIDSTT